MSSHDTKGLLLAKGAEILHRKGFHDSGIQEVLEATGVPKGSFYYYFRSKEDFGLQVIDIYTGVIFQTLHTNMDNHGNPVLERLKGFFRDMTEHAVEGGYTGCPLGNLSQELGGVSEVFRQKLNGIFDKLEQEIAAHLREAQAAGDVSNQVPAAAASALMVNSWEGALLRMKLTKERGPYQVFEEFIFNDFLIHER